jgi:hypothetical protein
MTATNDQPDPYNPSSHLLSVVVQPDDLQADDRLEAAAAAEAEARDKSLEEKFCRICLETDEPDELMSPCGCRGSLQHVHFQCLKESVIHLKCYKCTICKKKFSGLEVKVDQIRSCLNFAGKSKWLIVMLIMLTAILTFQLSVCLMMLIRALDKENRDYLQAVTSCFWMIFYTGFYVVFAYCCIKTQWKNRKQILVVIRSE